MTAGALQSSHPPSIRGNLAEAALPGTKRTTYRAAL
jgi:hypothetical protein